MVKLKIKGKQKLSKEPKTPGTVIPEKAEVVKKPKAKAKKTEGVTFPADCRINAYGFLGFKVGWLSALGWHKGMSLKIEKNGDGNITLRKT